MSGAPPCFNLFGLVIILFGLFAVISPETAWHLQEGWKFRNAEPSDLSLIMTRIGGVIAIVIGLLVMLGILF
ncbi:MAG: hypothetical protein GX552_13405 [Chloroflexi bacterium]|jgi:uncharacterized protein YjeT (DUF2065 family)|nr:hypothetical protein [Chloroflexota bacterium]